MERQRFNLVAHRNPSVQMSRRQVLLAGAAAVVATGLFGSPALASTETAGGKSIEIWKLSTCGCCGRWSEYLRDKGYRLTVNVVPDLTSVNKRFGVPEALESCHTAIIDGYVIAGHVPESAISKLMAERPNVRGIALPGMPPGSPGMDGPPGVYRVMSFRDGGQVDIFAEVRP